MLKKSTLRKNRINLYGIIWVQFPPALQSEFEGDQEYIKKLSNIQLFLAVHQGQDVDIWHRTYFKWILLWSYCHEDHIMSNTRNR